MERHKLYDGKVTLLYDDVPHTYNVNGTDYVSATKVTGVLDKPKLRNWYISRSINYMREHIHPGVAYDEIQLKELFKDAFYGGHRARDTAANIGKEVHSWIERHIKHQIASGGRKEKYPLPVHDGMRSSVNKFLAWEEETNPSYIFAERKLVSMEHMYAGTVDIVYRDTDGDLIVSDLKTGKSIYEEHWLQAAAYVGALLEENPKELDDGYGEVAREIIHIPLKGKLRAYNMKTDTTLDNELDVFRSLVTVWYWKEGAKG